MEKDSQYVYHLIISDASNWVYSHVPRTRSELGIPPETPGRAVNYTEYLEDTPIYTITLLLIHQLIGFPLYLASNLGGQRSFPSWLVPFAQIESNARRNQTLMSCLGPVTITVSERETLN